MNPDTTTSAPKVGSSAVVLPLRHEADEHRRNKTDPAQGRVDALLKAFEIVQRLAEWSRKYPRQQVHSFSAKVDEQLIAIEEEAKALLDGQNGGHRRKHKYGQNTDSPKSNRRGTETPRTGERPARAPARPGK